MLYKPTEKKSKSLLTKIGVYTTPSTLNIFNTFLMLLGLVITMSFHSVSLPLGGVEVMKSSNVPIQAEQAPRIANKTLVVQMASVIEVELIPTCELGFQSNNDGWVNPNSLTLSSISDHSDCADKQTLVKLAHYESTQTDVCNQYGYCGEYQIGGLAWSDCHDAGIYDDSHCAIFHFDIDAVNRFESVSRNLNSFDI